LSISRVDFSIDLRSGVPVGATIRNQPTSRILKVSAIARLKSGTRCEAAARAQFPL
jgi:hypothetical protein